MVEKKDCCQVNLRPKHVKKAMKQMPFILLCPKSNLFFCSWPIFIIPSCVYKTYLHAAQVTVPFCSTHYSSRYILIYKSIKRCRINKMIMQGNISPRANIAVINNEGKGKYPPDLFGQLG
jgi:hypothetical protein